MANPSMVMLREASINKTKIARPLPGSLLGCCRVAPGRPFRVRPSNPLTWTNSVQVPFTKTVAWECFSSLERVLLRNWHRSQFTTTGSYSITPLPVTVWAFAPSAAKPITTNRLQMRFIVSLLMDSDIRMWTRCGAYGAFPGRASDIERHFGGDADCRHAR